MPPLVLQDRMCDRRGAVEPLTQFDDLLRELIANGGPMPNDYARLNRTLRQLGDAVRANLIARDEALAYAQDITHRHLEGTMQARALGKNSATAATLRSLRRFTRCKQPRSRICAAGICISTRRQHRTRCAIAKPTSINC